LQGDAKMMSIREYIELQKATTWKYLEDKMIPTYQKAMIVRNRELGIYRTLEEDPDVIFEHMEMLSREESYTG
jgi:hypothetical protein